MREVSSNHFLKNLEVERPSGFFMPVQLADLSQEIIRLAGIFILGGSD
jgi:hypothetical protein